MRKVIMSLGLVLGIVAWGVGIFGLVTTSYPRVVPVPNAITVYGCVAMMGTILLLVIVFAHGTRAGDVD